LPKIEEDGKSWLRTPKLYKGVVEPYKKKKNYPHLEDRDKKRATLNSLCGCGHIELMLGSRSAQLTTTLTFN